MPRYREWDRDPEDYRPRPTRENPYQRRRHWDDEDYYADKRKDHEQDDDWNDDERR